MAELLARLKQRKLVQWALAYIAASFALIQVIDVVASRFDWPMQLEPWPRNGQPHGSTPTMHSSSLILALLTSACADGHGR